MGLHHQKGGPAFSCASRGAFCEPGQTGNLQTVAGLLNRSSCRGGGASRRYVAGAAGVAVEGVCEEGGAWLFGGRELSS